MYINVFKLTYICTHRDKNTCVYVHKYIPIYVYVCINVCTGKSLYRYFSVF